MHKLVSVFNRHGLKALLISKFIIGLDSITSPLSGVTRVPRSTFLALDGSGALLWLIAYMGVGYIFKDRLDYVARYSEETGLIVGVIMIAVGLTLMLRILIHRARFAREFRLAEITLDHSRDELT